MSIGILYPQTKLSARGGYIRLEYLPVSEVDAWIRIVDYGKFVGILSLKSFGLWRTMPTVQGAPRPWSVGEKDTKNGTHYPTVASGVLMGGRGSDFATLTDMKESKHLVRITLPNGLRFLLADYEHPATFSSKKDAGGNGAELSRTNFSFSAKLPYPIYEI